MIYEVLPIWEKGEYNGKKKDFEPTLAVYALEGKKKRPTVLVCPGGGYSFTSQREAEPIAMRFLKEGYNAFILYYSCEPNRHPQPLLDATRAMCMIRDNCEKWHVDPEKIAVIGFSAGGHLATSLCTCYMLPELQNIKGMEKGKNRPDLLISCYPVITSGEKAHRGSFDNLCGDDKALADSLSLEKCVHDDMPPAFIWHTFTDGGVPVENSLLLASAMKEHNVPFELHIFPNGCHGLSTVDAETCGAESCDPHTARWLDLCMEWMKIYFETPAFDPELCR